jgi:glutamine synthetase
MIVKNSDLIKKTLSRIKKDNVSLIELQFSDFLGNVKSCTITPAQAEESLTKGTWFDGSSVEGFARIHESDMFLLPDPSTYASLPWRSQNGNGAVIRFICDVYLPNGEPFEGDPRFILKKALKEAKALGFDYYTGPELEFFLFPRDEDGQIRVCSQGNGFYFVFSLDKTWEIKRKMIESLEMMGIRVEMGHYEVADNQHEIDIHYDKALKTADNALTLKYTLKSIANQFGWAVTFMPKPIYGINGSGMHTHQSLFKGKDNAFYSKTDRYSLSKVAYQFLAGQLKYARQLSALLSPLVNSYKRLTPGFEAPVYICWARRNRSALIRIPLIHQDKHQATRMELRCPDPSANPYLAFAAMLKAGLAGIKEKLSTPAPVEEDVYEFDDSKLKKYYINQLPATLIESLEEMRKSKIIKDLLGEYTFSRYLASKKQEWDSFRVSVTDWELNHYLTVV